MSFFRSDLKANRVASHVQTSQVVTLALSLLVSIVYLNQGCLLSITLYMLHLHFMSDFGIPGRWYIPVNSALGGRSQRVILGYVLTARPTWINKCHTYLKSKEIKINKVFGETVRERVSSYSCSLVCLFHFMALASCWWYTSHERVHTHTCTHTVPSPGFFLFDCVVKCQYC